VVFKSEIGVFMLKSEDGKRESKLTGVTTFIKRYLVKPFKSNAIATSIDRDFNWMIINTKRAKMYPWSVIGGFEDVYKGKALGTYIHHQISRLVVIATESKIPLDLLVDHTRTIPTTQITEALAQKIYGERQAMHPISRGLMEKMHSMGLSPVYTNLAVCHERSAVATGIDVLCRDKVGRWVVVEIKTGKRDTTISYSDEDGWKDPLGPLANSHMHTYQVQTAFSFLMFIHTFGLRQDECAPPVILFCDHYNVFNVDVPDTIIRACAQIFDIQRPVFTDTANLTPQRKTESKRRESGPPIRKKQRFGGKPAIVYTDESKRTDSVDPVRIDGHRLVCYPDGSRVMKYFSNTTQQWYTKTQLSSSILSHYFLTITPAAPQLKHTGPPFPCGCDTSCPSSDECVECSGNPITEDSPDEEDAKGQDVDQDTDPEDEDMDSPDPADTYTDEESG